MCFFGYYLHSVAKGELIGEGELERRAVEQTTAWEWTGEERAHKGGYLDRNIHITTRQSMWWRLTRPI